MRIDLSRASICFRRREVFRGVSVTFPSGLVSALIGPSGSGKSSLLAAIAGYQPLAEGSIRITGDNGREHEPNPAFVAWVPQGSNALGSRSAIDNVMIAALAAGADLRAARACAIQCLARVGLTSEQNQPARSLSGGELQRLALARALASGKPIILADEPSANLDAHNTEMVADVLASLSSRSTIIVATHDPLLLRGANHVVDLRAVS